MEIFFAALIFIGLSVFGLCFNIIFRKNGKFPETEIANNTELRKRGIRCAKEEELRLWNRKGRNVDNNTGCSSCAGCDIMFNKSNSNNKISE